MGHEKLLTLQGSWRYHQVPEGIELRSIIQEKRLLFKGLDIEKMLAFFSDLAIGAPEGAATKALSRSSNLPVKTVESILSRLNDHGALIVRDASVDFNEAEHHLADRQIRFFNAFETPEMTGEDFNERLQNRKVVIVGLGGYGTWIALLCARMGIKHIVGIDGDIVELSNLNRQVLYYEKDIGKLKAEACKTSIKEINKGIKFESHPIEVKSYKELMPIIDGADLVFNSFGYILPNDDHPHVSENVALAALNAGIPSLLFSGSWVGPLNIPGENACYWCVMSNERVSAVAQASAPMPNTRFLPAFAPRVAMSTSLAVWEATRFLSGIDRTLTLDGLISLDLFKYEKHNLIKIPKSPSCSVCGGI